MTNEENSEIAYSERSIEILKGCFEDTIWMAVRYAHGRHTYSPDMVRDAVKAFKTVFPDWKMRRDVTILPPEEGEVGGFSLRRDYLNDLFEEETK